jgi:serine/threonine-protein kinase HipA
VRAGSRAPLNIWMNGELVGTWSPQRASASTFAYAGSWLDSPRTRALSLSLPFLPSNAAHRGAHVDAWFENLLPDSRQIRERIRTRFKTRSLEASDLLAAVGRDCVGAVQVLPADTDAGDVRHIDAQALDAAGVARQLRATTSSRAFGPADDSGLPISIAGAQEKTALLRRDGAWYIPRGATPTTHILKLPLGLIGSLQADMRDSVENEWLCAQVLSALGFDVADTEIGRFEDDAGVVKALVVQRFDREAVEQTKQDPAWIVRLPQEDMCQATGTPPDNKYETDGGPGIPQILTVLQASQAPTRDALTFAKAQLAFWLLAAPDGHAKNFSIFLKRDGYSLTPLYDVLSAWPVVGKGPNTWAYQDVTLAMAIRGSRPYRALSRIAVRQWRRLAQQTAVPEAFDEMLRMVEDADRALSRVEQRLPADFPGYVWESIATGVRRHRDRFLTGVAQERERDTDH